MTEHDIEDRLNEAFEHPTPAKKNTDHQKPQLPWWQRGDSDTWGTAIWIIVFIIIVFLFGAGSGSNDMADSPSATCYGHC